MQQRLPRWRPFVGAPPPAQSVGRPAAPVDDPWAGDDEAWADEDVVREAPADFIRFFRGAAFGVLAGLALWALIGLTLVLLFR